MHVTVYETEVKLRIESLASRGCKAVIFVEFVPVTEESKELAPGDEEREYLANEIARLRERYPEMVFVSFPGDEKSSGGCLAAGRGFSISIHMAVQNRVPSHHFRMSIFGTRA